MPLFVKVKPMIVEYVIGGPAALSLCCEAQATYALTFNFVVGT